MKTSYEMTQSVLKKQKKILRRRKAILTAVGASAGAAVIALGLAIMPKKGIDLVGNSKPVSSITLPAGESTPPLDLLGFIGFGQGKYFIATDIWQKSDDYALFRKYFFGTWESSDKSFSEKMVIDDTKQAYYCKTNPFRFDNFYIISENVLAFVIQGNAEYELFWLDINSPETMYHEPFVEDWQMNSVPPESAENKSFGSGWLYDIDELPHKPAVYSKTSAPISVSEENYLSIFELREISRDYGIDLDMLLNIEYNDKNSGERLLHDDWYQFYPVFLVSKAPDKLVLRTKIGNIIAENEEIDVTYTIEKSDGAWARTEKIGISDLNDVLEINDDVLSELGMTFGELSEKYGREPEGEYNQYIIENGYGKYIWKNPDGAYYDDMDLAGGCNMIDGIKLNTLFEGITYPLSYEELEEKSGIKLIEAAKEIGLDSCYWSTFEHTAYSNVSFIISTGKYDVIDADSRCCLVLNSAEKTNDIISTEEGISFKTAAQNAAEAFLRGDADTLSEYLYNPDYDAVLSENSENLFDEIESWSLILPTEPISVFETDKVYPVIYQFTLKGKDMRFYLDMGLIKTAGGWKADYIYLQG